MTEEAVRGLARLVEEAAGYVVPERGLGQLAAVARERAAALGCRHVREYLDLLETGRWPDEWRRLLDRITVKESYLFRGRGQLRALAEVLLPELAARRQRPLRVWSAGCARGEEPVTLAIVLANHPCFRGAEWTILATDVDEGALADARRGLYGRRAVAAVPPELLERHFAESGGRYRVDPGLAARIRYRRLNLMEVRPHRGLPEAPFDLIFLRNVLIYFRPESQQRVVSAVEQALDNHGWLLVGPTESLLRYQTALQPRDLGECFCYGRPERGAGASGAIGSPALPSADSAGPVRGPARPTAPAALDRRIEAVVRALERGDARAGRRMASDLRLDYPDSALVRTLEGLAWMRSGHPRRAVLAYRAALYLAPEVAVIRYLSGLALEAAGSGERARREFRAVVAATEPPPGGAWALLERLDVPGQDRAIESSRRKLYFIE